MPRRSGSWGRPWTDIILCFQRSIEKNSSGYGVPCFHTYHVVTLVTNLCWLYDGSCKLCAHKNAEKMRADSNLGPQSIINCHQQIFFWEWESDTQAQNTQDINDWHIHFPTFFLRLVTTNSVAIYCHSYKASTSRGSLCFELFHRH